ncbi:hypothetical protein CWE08_08645 [Aliidiomarina iranensis]|uniref:Uncharacterized protein n=1 Tax=Aliidiomarina iranensis TaxID=1434071 RepID=A0A432VU19_9GAMM|nr:hypothetical protein [Aliidiomarina iranensis]RUO19975.1 hypothetical protein CWE08_08645 [Aliidiomarina iranensis]
MRWKPYNFNDINYNLNHLHPHSMFTELSTEQRIEILVTYGFHVFTDEKQNEYEVNFRGESRYFSLSRYHSSFDLPNMLKKSLQNGYVARYLSKNRAEQFFHLDSNDYSVFFELRKPANRDNCLKLQVVSAYEVEQWGRSTLPKGKKYKWTDVVYRKVNGNKF